MLAVTLEGMCLGQVFVSVFFRWRESVGGCIFEVFLRRSSWAGEGVEVTDGKTRKSTTIKRDVPGVPQASGETRNVHL